MVVVETEWGRIEEITLTYVVVHIWDDRRLIMPSTYFTTTPFQNWTRRESAVLGAVDLDIDWRVPLTELRAELDRALQASEIWDERVGILQVTDAVGSFVRVPGAGFRGRRPDGVRPAMRGEGGAGRFPATPPPAGAAQGAGGGRPARGAEPVRAR